MSEKQKEYSFIELMEFFQCNELTKESASLDEGAEVSDYLHKGERILSLLREKEHKSNFHPVPFLDAIVYKTYANKTGQEKVAYVLQCMRNKILRPVTNGIEERNPDLSEILEQLPGLGNCIRAHEATESAAKMVAALTTEGYQGSIALSISGFEEEVYVPVKEAKLSSRVHGAGNFFWKKKRSERFWVADMASIFSLLALFCQLRQEVRNRWKSLSKQQLEDEPVYCMLQSELEESLRIHSFRDHDMILYDEFTQEDTPFVRHCLKERGYTPKNWLKLSEEERTAFCLKDRRSEIQKSSFGALFFLEEELSVSELKLMFKAYRTGRKSYSMYLDVGVLPDLMVKIIDKMIFEYQEDKTEALMEAYMKKEYATAFITKRNIPKAVLKAMEESSFNQYFGYVEYDEDVDLSLMDEVYREFQALAEFLGLKPHEYEQVSLRFRKLGKHKAAGLYYYILKCLCVDVRYPSSFSHELFHMLDYERGKVSRGAAFAPVWEKYREAVEKEIVKDKALSAKLDGKSKYNREYYLQASESFARCGEIYLTRICGIENSIVKPDRENDFAYPEDKELERRIRAYFNGFFGLSN